MAWAVDSLSPVSMTMCSMPWARNARRASSAPGRTGSAMAITPSGSSTVPTATTVLPCSSRPAMAAVSAGSAACAPKSSGRPTK